MASTPNWIGINRGGQWAVRLTTQVITRTGTPPESALLANITSANGGMIEGLKCEALGTNVSAVLFLVVLNPSAGSYHLIGQLLLPATGTPTLGAAFTDASQDANAILPVTLFPSSNTTTPNRALRLAPGAKLYACLDRAVASGWDVLANGGEC